MSKAPLAQIAIQCLGPGGIPVKEPSLAIDSPDHEMPEIALFGDEEGKLTVRLYPGTYELEARDGDLIARTRLKVNAGQTAASATILFDAN